MKERFPDESNEINASNIKTPNNDGTAFGINTSTYSATSNSSGQDNLGQILQSIFSFRELKSKLGDKFAGGILCIDELDATLHPGAQNLLFDYLLESSKEIGIQIVFTAHSLSLLNHVTEIQQTKDNKNNIQNLYFDLEGDHESIKIIDNPSMSFIKNGLMSTFYQGKKNSQVQLLMEDATAREFFKKIIEESSSAFEDLFMLNQLDISIAWNSLINFIASDSDLYNKSITILDGDLKKPNNADSLQNLLNKASFNVSTQITPSHLFILPMENNIEKELITFVMDSKRSIDFYNDSYVYQNNLKLDNLQDSIDDQYPNGLKITKEYKKIYNEILSPYKGKMAEYWIKENKDDVNYFIKSVFETFKKISADLWPY